MRPRHNLGRPVCGHLRNAREKLKELQLVSEETVLQSNSPWMHHSPLVEQRTTHDASPVSLEVLAVPLEADRKSSVKVSNLFSGSKHICTFYSHVLVHNLVLIAAENVQDEIWKSSLTEFILEQSCSKWWMYAQIQSDSVCIKSGLCKDSDVPALFINIRSSFTSGMFSN